MTGLVSPGELVGHRLAGVTVAWHEHAGRRNALATHVWLDVERVGSVQLHTPGDGSLGLARAERYRSYDMGEQGRVVVEPAAAPFALAGHTGEEIVGTGGLATRDGRRAIGVVIRFESGAVAVVNVADELLVLPWPSPQWDEMGIAVTP